MGAVPDKLTLEQAIEEGKQKKAEDSAKEAAVMSETPAAEAPVAETPATEAPVDTATAPAAEKPAVAKAAAKATAKPKKKLGIFLIRIRKVPATAKMAGKDEKAENGGKK